MSGVSTEMVSHHIKLELPDERLNAKSEGSTHLGYTGLCVGLEHLKIKTYVVRFSWFFVYYETIKRESKINLILNVGVMKD
jgi:hypothetical protein